ncbi:MAG: hypothetical protein AAGA65_27385 [Actinomycetota bacterium]
MERREIADDDRGKARQLLLGWLAGDSGDVEALIAAAGELHISHHTFPGEDFMRVAIDALDFAGVGRDAPIACETLLADHLPEIEFRGKENRKIRFVVLATAARRSGLEPALLEEIRFWNDDCWRYALYTALALVRAAAAKTSQPVPELARPLATHHNPHVR